MLRIEMQDETPKYATYEVIGQLTAGELPALVELIGEVESSGRVLRLDLSDLTLADRATVEFFCRGDGSEVELVRCPPYLRSWLSGEGRETTR
jgi:ABC-type transporter Mla MlaB component